MWMGMVFPKRWRKRIPELKWEKNPIEIKWLDTGYAWEKRRCKWKGCHHRVNNGWYEWCYYHWRMIPNRLRSMYGQALWKQSWELRDSDGSSFLYRVRAKRIEDWIEKNGRVPFI